MLVVRDVAFDVRELEGGYYFLFKFVIPLLLKKICNLISKNNLFFLRRVKIFKGVLFIEIKTLDNFLLLNTFFVIFNKFFNFFFR